MLGESESADRQHGSAQADGRPEQSQADGGDSWLGKLIGERYRIDRILSQGGMGVVYAARHVVLDIDVAVKVLRQSPAQSQERRFVREARLACTVRHPNTVQIMDFGVCENGRAYLVMELLQGRTLSSELAKGRLVVLRVCHIGAQIARGLQAIHERGIVHCDMKPSNVILLKQDGTSDFVKILDFGIAKSIERGTEEQPAEPVAGSTGAGTTSGGSRTGKFAGTPRYMSPEQCQGLPLDERSDQYSFGCMLYELITGQPPFQSATARELMLEHISAPVEPPRERVPQLCISSALESLVLRMMAKDPALRFSSLHEVEEALLREAEGIRKKQEETSSQPRRRGWRTLPAWALGTGTGLLGLLLATAAGWGGGGRQLPMFRRPAPLLLVAAEPQMTSVFGNPPPVQLRPAEQPTAVPRPSPHEVKLSENPSEAAVQAARRAARAQDFPLALKELERAVILCPAGYPAQPRKSCDALDRTLALERGQIFESQKRWGEALLEYQQAEAGADEKERVLAQAAMARLAPRFGKVVIRTYKNGTCQQETEWLEPGHRHQVKLGNTRQEIQVAAGQTLELGACP